MPHIHERIDFTVSVYLVNGDAVLLRKHDKYNMWLPVGGHIELDENPNEAAIREAKEESGIAVTLMGVASNISEGEGYTELIPPAFMNIHHISDTHQHNDLVYFAHAPTREIKQTEVHNSDLKWFTESELSDPRYALSDTIILYATEALKANK